MILFEYTYNHRNMDFIVVEESKNDCIIDILVSCIFIHIPDILIVKTRTNIQKTNTFLTKALKLMFGLLNFEC